MEIPLAHRARAPPVLPEIYVQDSIPSERIRMSSRSSSYNLTSSPAHIPGPMSIPNVREPVPPPLPPPQHIPDIADSGHKGSDIAWQWGNSRQDSDWGKAVAPGSSLYGGFASKPGFKESRPESFSRTSSASTIKSVQRPVSRESHYPKLDEGYASFSGTSIDSNRSRYHESSSVRSGFQSSVHDTYRSNAQAFDKSQLQKLDARRSSDSATSARGRPRSPFSLSMNDASPTSRTAAIELHYPNQLKPLSMPILPGKPFVESPISRWTASTLSSEAPSGNPFTRYNSAQLDFRSPSEITEPDRSPLSSTWRSTSGSLASIYDEASNTRSRENSDQRVSPDQDVDFPMEETGFRRLQIDDCSTRQGGYLPAISAGQKRRASSPPVEDQLPVHSIGSSSELFLRRESGSRTHAPSGSLSSTASGLKNGSYAFTTLSVTASSATSMGSSGSISSGWHSPIPTDGSESPYSTSMSLNPSPRGSISRQDHTRILPETWPALTTRRSSKSATESKPTPSTKDQGSFVCECCPKKPKKFDSKRALGVHEQEKQYECAYCRNRFKNKNEAERHQNSLHLRRHSWSCAALSGFAAAFHPSPVQPNDADSCGYCGEDFTRSGLSSANSSGPQVAAATEQDWDARIAHLLEMHKWGECNHAKKFFRADHFRQHLKHSHAGTSGKWTNMLENACMKDEPLPEPIRGSSRLGAGKGRVGRINEEDEMM
ncbi:hypothetical protein BJ878DRAFT_160569 [Calycina marina]|uniref:C2H2-type domain-containing protein n=1 Tax=Calycina marina TaxID=1763456 RepID=A0A9P8CDC6_9HELO|nr:hypothetical protein BJ878DRAFT_160569 [Calycina marina]